MKLNIRGIKLDVTPAIKEHVENKITKLDVYFENPEEITATVLLKVKGINQIVEVTVPTTKFTLRAEETHNDLYASVDLVIDKLERQIRKNKSKLKKYRHNQTPDLSFSEVIYEEETPEEALKIVKRKEIASKPMDEEEAMLQMELLNHDFFVFKNIDEECISVLYLRKDGNYGIINVK